MKKLLILAYDFPPYVSVGGLRPYNWLKYLRDFDIDPIVVTRHWSNDYGSGLDYVVSTANKESIIEHTEWGTIIRTPYQSTWANQILLKYGENQYRLLRKILTGFDEVRQFISVSGSKKQIYSAANTYLQNTKVDAIIATGSPFVLFFYAKKLSEQFSIPWIADYRDPWSQNKGFHYGTVYTRWNTFLEKRISGTAHEIITVSDFIQFKLSEILPMKVIHILPNGYDPDVITEVEKINQSTDCLTISFVGTIYEWHPWKSFLSVFSSFVEHITDMVKINFYGINKTEEVISFLQQLPEKTQKSVSIYSRMPNQELLSKIAQENVMLLFNYYSYMGTKIFDYLGIKRKIILCYGNDLKALQLKEQFYTIEEDKGFSQQLQADLIIETNSGVVVRDEDHLMDVFHELLDEFRINKRIESHAVGVENYSRKIQVKKLAEIVTAICEKTDRTK
jgi:glycosyltransferase involved in cell wall biosynthesis